MFIIYVEPLIMATLFMTYKERKNNMLSKTLREYIVL